MKTDNSVQIEQSIYPFRTAQSRRRQWLVRIVMIAVLFVVLLSAFSSLGVIVESFFVTLYVD